MHFGYFPAQKAHFNTCTSVMFVCVCLFFCWKTKFSPHVSVFPFFFCLFVADSTVFPPLFACFHHFSGSKTRANHCFFYALWFLPRFGRKVWLLPLWSLCFCLWFTFVPWCGTSVLVQELLTLRSDISYFGTKFPQAKCVVEWKNTWGPRWESP